MSKGKHEDFIAVYTDYTLRFSYIYFTRESLFFKVAKNCTKLDARRWLWIAIEKVVVVTIHDRAHLLHSHQLTSLRASLATLLT